MLYRGVLITTASGRLDQAVFSRNRGGDYIRALGNPNPNPATAEQLAMRTSMADIITAWQGMSSDERSEWETYSEDHPGTSRIGLERPAGGLAEFTRLNICRAQQNNWLALTGLPLVTTPPLARVTPATIPLPTATAALGTKKVTVDVLGTEDWYNEGDAGLLIYSSEWLNPTINFYRSPMTLRTMMSAGTTGASVTFSLAVNSVAGQRARLRFKILRADGLVSLDWWLDVPAT